MLTHTYRMTELTSNSDLCQIKSTQPESTPKGYEDYRKFEASKTTPNVVIEMIAYSWHSNLG